MNEQDQEIVATCEAAVTHLTVDGGWVQGTYLGYGEVITWSEDKRSYTVDYTKVEACLGGALVLAGLASKVIVNDDVRWFNGDGGTVANCPAVPAVAAVIREKHPGVAASKTSSETEDESLIYAFNDAHDRVVDDVIDVLNETIKRHSSEVIEP